MSDKTSRKTVYGHQKIRKANMHTDSDSDSFIWSYCRPRRPLLRPNLVAVAKATWKKIKYTVYMYVQIIVIIKSISIRSNTTTNHGADRATSCHSGTRHEKHTQVCPRNKRRQTMDCPHCIHPRHHAYN